MVQLLQVVAILTVAVAMALSLAHALELHGKMRLSREHYLAVQPIYYPGFSVGGMAEPLGIALLIVLLFLLPTGDIAFWLTAGALLSLLAMHAAYWLLTHPVNNFWLKDVDLKGAGARFFAFASAGRKDGVDASWTNLRDQWEISHVVRAVFGFLSLLLLATAVAF